MAIVAVAATGAFFSDTETSTGNQFVAGSLDLQVDNECHYWTDADADGTFEDIGCLWEGVGGMLANWDLTDLQDGVHKYFFFDDVKPGDFGEDTVSLHVFDNDAWGRLVITNVLDDGDTCTEPETETADADCTGQTPGNTETDGELREELLFQVWLDQGTTVGFQCAQNDPGCTADLEEGDNVRQNTDEPLLVTQGTIDAGGETHNIWEGLALVYSIESCTGDGSSTSDCPGIAPDGQMIGSITYYFGISWILPDTVGNEVQSDILGADIAFEVEQYRNNPTPFP